MSVGLRTVNILNVHVIVVQIKYIGFFFLLNPIKCKINIQSLDIDANAFTQSHSHWSHYIMWYIELYFALF